MSASQELFQWAGRALEGQTAMGLAQCRGTVRLALKQVGLQPDQLSVSGLRVVLAEVMPRELRVRGFDNAENICLRLAEQLETEGFDAEAEQGLSAADDAFARIFG